MGFNSGFKGLIRWTVTGISHPRHPICPTAVQM